MLPESTTVEAVLADLPQKVRVHVLAKRLGMTSKDLIAALAQQGVVVKSAQSSVTSDVAAHFVATVFADAAGEPEAADASPATTADPEPTATADTAPASPFMNPFTTVQQVEPMTAQLPQDPFTSGAVADPFAVNAMLQAAAPIVVTAQDMGQDESSDEDSADQEDNDSRQNDDDASSSSRRRRRRGRRGRGRGRGDDADSTDDASEDTTHDGDNADRTDKGSPSGSKNGQAGSKKKQQKQTSASDTEENTAKSSDTADADSADEGGEDTTSTHRRRRRRRRSDVDTDENTQDDPPNTVVHERGNTRRRRSSGSDEVQGISGSTRLEAKRQRRREGRDNARNRIPVLSEAEFLARRESVERTMVVREKERSDHPGVTTQVGVLEDNILVEHFVTSDSQASMVGNIYLGRVQNVLPSMEAAFIDIGRGRNAVLYAGEVNWAAAGLGGKSRKIEQALSTGDMVVVQVSKDPIAHKGARLTTQISMAGRYLVYVPDGSSAGISRKLPDTERKRLKSILKNIVPGDAGVIIRTAAEGASEEDLKRDIDMLHKQWLSVQQAAEEAQQKADGKARTLHEEPTMLVKVVRDLFNDDFKKLVVEGERAWETITNYVHMVAPQLGERLERWDNTGVDVFQAYRVDEQLAKALDRKVWLPSGGTLVIDRTEAMTVIDVNTGKFTGSGGNLEETVTRNNLEAAEEIVRQLRLRDIGGIVIVDFIDMVLESNRDLVLRRLREALGRDRTRHQVSEVTSLGLIQLTRKRLGTGLLEAFSKPCPHCSGTGYILQEDPVESITSGTNAEDLRGGRRRKGRNAEKQEKNDAAKGGKSKDKNAADKDSKSKGGNGGKDHQGPNPSEHPMMKAMGRKKDEDSSAADTTPTNTTDTTPEATASSESGETHDQQGASAHADTETTTSVDAGQSTTPAQSTDSAEATESADNAPTSADSEDEAGESAPRRRRRRGRRHGARSEQQNDEMDQPVDIESTDAADTAGSLTSAEATGSRSDDERPAKKSGKKGSKKGGKDTKAGKDGKDGKKSGKKSGKKDGQKSAQQGKSHDASVSHAPASVDEGDSARAAETAPSSLPSVADVALQTTTTPRERRGARRATQAAGSATTHAESPAPAERKEVVAGVLAAAPVAVNASAEEKAPRRTRRRATRSS